MRDTDDDFWDLMKELDFKFEEKFKVSLSDYDKAAQYINDEYFKKRSSNNAELNDEGKTEENLSTHIEILLVKRQRQKD